MGAPGTRKGKSERSIRRHSRERKDRAQQSLGDLLRGTKAAAILGLGLTDARGAARFVLGADAAESDVAELAKLARSKKMAPYREGQVAALARKATCALSLAMDHAIESTPTVPPQCAANHLRMVHEVADKLGGSDAMFSEIRYELSVQVSE